jgi:hypothetical protein
MEKLNLKKDKRLKGVGEIETIFILGIDDINNPDVTLKTRGLKIDILYVPKQFKSIFENTECYKQLVPSLTANNTQGKGEIRYY